MTTIESFHGHDDARSGRAVAGRIMGVLAQAALVIPRALVRWQRQRRDRAAFMTLLGKDEWVYRDLGIGRGDVEWAARLPMHQNAAREVDKIRAQSRQSW